MSIFAVLNKVMDGCQEQKQNYPCIVNFQNIQYSWWQKSIKFYRIVPNQIQYPRQYREISEEDHNRDVFILKLAFYCKKIKILARVEIIKLKIYKKLNIHVLNVFVVSCLAWGIKESPIGISVKNQFFSDQIFHNIKTEFNWKQYTNLMSKKVSQKYNKISYEDRMKLIQMVCQNQIPCSMASKQLGISISTGKMIVKQYRETGKVFEKKQDKLKRQAVEQYIQNKQENEKNSPSPDPPDEQKNKKKDQQVIFCFLPFQMNHPPYF